MVRVLARSLHLLLQSAIGLGGTCRELLLDAQCDVQRERRHRLDKNLTNRVVEGTAVNRLTDTWLATIDATTPAPIIRDGLAMIAVVPHSHTLPAVATDRESLEQGRPFARWTPPTIGATRLGIHVEAAQILFVLLPGDIAGVDIGQQNPLIARHAYHA